MPRKQKLVSAILLLACFVASLYLHPSAVKAQVPLRIVTTTTIVADLARTVAQDRGAVTSLLKIGADPHTYQPIPADLEAIERADVILLHGVGLDRRVAQDISRSQSKAFIRTVTTGLEPRGIIFTSNDHGHTRSHVHDEGDPHFWFDPNHVKVYVNNIAETLASVDPANADFYHTNAAVYLGELHRLDEWIRARVQEISPHRKKLVTNHDTLGYFADRYGFEIVGSIFPNFSSDSQPSARQLAHLIQTFEQAGIKTLFAETTLSPRLLTTVAKELGPDVKIVQLYTDSLSDENGPAPTYLDFMRYNVDQIVKALKEDTQ